MRKAEKLFEQAEAAAKDEPELLNRVQVARLPVRYVWAARWRDFETEARKEGQPWPGPAGFIENARTFLEVARRNSITMLSEGRKIESFEERTIGLGRHESQPPPGCEKLGPDDYVDLQDNVFHLASEGTWAALAHDDLASDGVAARMPGDHPQWATQLVLEGFLPDPDAVYTVYASIRCEKIGDDGEAFSYGVWDMANRRDVGRGSVACKDVKDGDYHTFKAAAGKLRSKMYIWVAPGNNPKNVKAVWVDRFWLVREKP
jgi:hypothetical protein